MGAAGKLFIDTSASKHLNNGALLGASRKMDCKESGCLVHIKTIHRQTQAERKGPSYDPTQLSLLHVEQGGVHVCFVYVGKSDPSQKASRLQVC